MKDDQIREAARALFRHDGAVKVPDHAQVSQTANGDFIVEAYVTLPRLFVDNPRCQTPRRSGSRGDGSRVYPCLEYVPGVLGDGSPGSLCDCGFRENEHGVCGNALPCSAHGEGMP